MIIEIILHEATLRKSIFEVNGPKEGRRTRRRVGEGGAK